MINLIIHLNSEESEVLYDAASAHHMTREGYVKWKVFGAGSQPAELKPVRPTPSLDVRKKSFLPPLSKHEEPAD